MTQFSLNLNKIALLRNSRGGLRPDLLEFARMAINAGVRGLTVHPRSDARHITFDDVRALSRLPQVVSKEVELNIEGDLRPDLIRLVEVLQPSQFTVVPVTPGEITSNRGWRDCDPHEQLSFVVRQLKGVRISVFSDATPQSCNYVINSGAQAIEIYTGPFAEAYLSGSYDKELSALVETSKQARSAALRINLGHDLTLDNIAVIRKVMEVDEVSIGHQFIIDALYIGWIAAVDFYLRACE